MRTIVGCTTVTNELVVVCDDGTAWLWGVSPPGVDASAPERFAHDQALITGRAASLPHAWIQFHMPIPGTRSDVAYQEEER
jgi:hypothetical protein